MEQFVPAPASVYNKCLNTQTVTKQELPKCQSEQNSMYQINSLREEKKQKAVCQSRLSSRQKFVSSSDQALKFVNFNIGWCGNWSLTVRLCSLTSS